MYSRVLKNIYVNVGDPIKIETVLEKKPEENNTSPLNEISKADRENALKDMELAAKRKAELIIQDAEKKAQEILKKAQEDYNNIVKSAVDKAEAKADSIKKQAYEQGYSEGHNIGKAEYDKLIAEALDIKKRAYEEYERTFRNMEGEIVELVLEIAKKVIGAEIKADKHNVVNLAKQAIDKCTNKENIVLYVSDDDYDYIKAHREELLKELEIIDEVSIKKDMSLKAGGCIVQTQYGLIDTSVETQIRKIEDAFRNLYTNRSSSGEK